MGLLKRLMGPEDGETATVVDLASGARPMRTALAALHARREELDPGRPEIDVRAIAVDLIRGEVAAPTPDVARLTKSGIDPDVWYEKEIARSWEGLNESQRAARVEQFAGLAEMLEGAGEDARPPNYEQMLASVRTKTLLLAFAFDETYGFLSRIGRAEPLS